MDAGEQVWPENHSFHHLPDPESRHALPVLGVTGAVSLGEVCQSGVSESLDD